VVGAVAPVVEPVQPVLEPVQPVVETLAPVLSDIAAAASPEPASVQSRNPVASATGPAADDAHATTPTSLSASPVGTPSAVTDVVGLSPHSWPTAASPAPHPRVTVRGAVEFAAPEDLVSDHGPVAPPLPAVASSTAPPWFTSNGGTGELPVLGALLAVLAAVGGLFLSGGRRVDLLPVRAPAARFFSLIEPPG
jgi:hypothetical protein